jgi:hypothetical protein
MLLDEIHRGRSWMVKNGEPHPEAFLPCVLRRHSFFQSISTIAFRIPLDHRLSLFATLLLLILGRTVRPYARDQIPEGGPSPSSSEAVIGYSVDKKSRPYCLSSARWRLPQRTSPLRFTFATALLVLGGLAAFYVWTHGRPRRVHLLQEILQERQVRQGPRRNPGGHC